MACYKLLLSLLFCFGFGLACGQVSENFADGDFTVNPAWTGDVSEWEVLNGELHLNNAAPAATNNSHLSTPSTAFSNAVWEFYVRMDFNPSSANYVDVFLASDLADLEAGVDGYFVRIGGTTDEVSLYESTGGSGSEIIDGQDGMLVGAPVDVRVRVTRDAAGLWELFSDTSGTGSNFFSEGTATDLSHNASAHFGILTRYSTTRNTWCYFDSISVTATIVPDTTKPVVLGVTAISPTEAEVSFSENVDLAMAQDVSNYLLNGAVNPVTAAVDASDSALVRLGFSSAFPVCSQQSIGISNVEDRAGNAMNASTQAFAYAVAGQASFKSVVINEIFADPTPQIGLPTVEFVELYNRGNVPVDLQGWTVSDGGSPQVITNSSYLLCPGEYVILTTDSSQYNAFGPSIDMSLPALNNAGDNLGLRDGASLIDSVTYALSWYGGQPWESGGYSLELINPTDTCSLGGANWSHSNDPSGGTPGTPNSILNTAPDVTAPSLLSVTIQGAFALQVCFDESLDPGAATLLSNYSVDNGLGAPSSATLSGTDLECVVLTFPTAIDTGILYTLTAANIGDCKGNALASQSGQFIIPGPALFRSVIFNEVFPDPDSSLTNMPNGEFFELYNRSGSLVDLGGWTFADASSRVTLGSYLLQPGAYVAVCRQADSAAYAAFGPVLTLSSLPSLNNTDDRLGLRDGSGTLIDTLEYDDSMYQDPNKAGGGYSLELINPSDTCSFFGNWIASNDPDGGTPGEQNSVFSNAQDITAPVLLGITVLSPTAIEVCFDETMDETLLGTASNYSIDNGLGAPSSAAPQGPGFACVVLSLSAPIDTGTIYTITFTNLTDCKGNSVGILTGTFVLGGSAAPFQILINELMADPNPAQGLPEEDFVELYNAGTTVVDLAGWVISDPSSTDAVLPSYNLFPGEYVVVCDDGDVSSFAVLTPNVVGTPSFPALNTTGDSVNLFDGTGALIDFVYYEDDWYGDPAKEDGGWTLERVDPGFTCLNAGNWRASANPLGGTPGAVNSVIGVFNDNESPGLVRAELLDASTVRVQFNELMEPGSLYDPQNYVIDNGVGNPLMVMAVGNAALSADLFLAAPLDTNVIYCVTASGLSDCPGNGIGSDNTVCFGIPRPAEAGDIVLNEILFNPYTGGSDFVELYNVSDKIIDLSTVYIGEIFEGTDSIYNADRVSASQLLFLPETYICLTADKEVQIQNYQPIDPDAIFEMSSFPTYDDAEGECVVFVDSATVLDRFAYLDDYQFPNLDDDNGVSLERHSFFRPTQDTDNWHSAASVVLYATPGYKNSQVLEGGDPSAEVWLSPETFSPDIDGVDDVLGINYQFNTSGWNARVTVFDNKGRLVRELQENTLLGTEAGAFTWDGTTDGGAKADVGVYVLLFEAVNSNTGEVKNFKLGCVLAARFN